MGWYTVTKKVKGRAYLYRQRSYRDGGKVRTESVYLGPAASGGAGSSATAKEEKTENGGAPQRQLDPVITTTNSSPEPYLQNIFQVLAEDVAQFQFSVPVIQREEARVRESMRRLAELLPWRYAAQTA